MTWRDVARGDLLHLRRSKMGWTVAGLMLLSTVGVAVTAFLMTLGGGSIPEVRVVLLFIAAIQVVLLPLVALVGSYGAIVTERKTGSVRFLLGLPNSRFDAYLGKLVSRTLLVAAPFTICLAAAWLFSVAVFDGLELVGFLAVLGWSLVYTVIAVGIGLTISASVKTETRAVAGIAASMLLFGILWPLAQHFALIVHPTEFLEYPRPPKPSWYYAIGQLNPGVAYTRLVFGTFGEGTVIPLAAPNEPLGYATTTALFAVLALVGWFVVAPWLGYSLFRSVDLP
ncbi:ABC transporter permease subunit [Haloarcula halophila]|uniref:ABC transporter permease subunit n=1 Tax=Haloarcula TaxID=2237 RepID=UPI0023E35333|nr:ABC transporter permease subunit [Halomicroarcula sp. DFY41]